ncbi:GNAT family N-acetyltransferase, partial [Kitasatospora sp. NPDC088134]|uniref:GNAT family N-acetyltransferase n=1 Tax=Kitasatospora sp. NPDC088134 TaxID=3364071 RepID=UPI00380AE199
TDPVATRSWNRVRAAAIKSGQLGGIPYRTPSQSSEQDATALLLAAGYRRVFSLVEMELGDLQELPERDGELPPGIRTGPIGPSDYRAAWRTVVDSYADAGFTQKWPFQDFVDTAEPACWRAAWNGSDMVGVALCSIRRHDHTAGEIEELSVRTDHQRRGIGRALLLDGLRSLREQGATTARLFTGTANPHRSYHLYESVGFQRQNEHVRYRKPLA